MIDMIPRTRWFAFSLRTMFVGVTLLATSLGWVCYSLNWVRERHALFALYEEDLWPLDKKTVSPGMLWIFGEKGQPYLFIAQPVFQRELDEMQKAFPEAKIEVCAIRPPSEDKKP
jgi:hypothetical protein